MSYENEVIIGFAMLINDVFKRSRWLETEFLWGLYEQFKNRFVFLKLISTEGLSILHWDLHYNKRDGTSSLICNRRPPPLAFLSYLYGLVKASNLNWTKRNESSSFTSEIRKMLTFLSRIYLKESNLFLIEFMFTWLKISLS